MNRKWDRIVDALLSGSPLEWIVFVVVVVGIVVAVRAVARYRTSLRDDADPAAADSLLVRHVRELRDRGEVSDHEYRSLKSRLQAPAGDPAVGRADGRCDRGSPHSPDPARSNAGLPVHDDDT